MDKDNKIEIDNKRPIIPNGIMVYSQSRNMMTKDQNYWPKRAEATSNLDMKGGKKSYYIK